jgi:hypothetical protein
MKAKIGTQGKIFLRVSVVSPAQLYVTLRSPFTIRPIV